MSQILQLEKGRRQRAATRSDGAAPSYSPDTNQQYLYLMLPEGDGFRVLRAPLEEIEEVPAALATGSGPAARDEIGIAGGSDLLLRIAHSRLSGEKALGEDRSRIRFGDVEIDVSTREVFRKNEVVPLAPLEFDLLLTLAERGGAAVSRKALLREVWGAEGKVAARTIDTKIAMLRRKLEDDPARPEHILTVSKVGYRLRA